MQIVYCMQIPRITLSLRICCRCMHAPLMLEAYKNIGVPSSPLYYCAVIYIPLCCRKSMIYGFFKAATFGSIDLQYLLQCVLVPTHSLLNCSCCIRIFFLPYACPGLGQLSKVLNANTHSLPNIGCSPYISRTLYMLMAGSNS